MNVRIINQNSPHNLPAEASHYAAPLSAYLADECGSSSFYTHYNTAKQLAHVTGSQDVPLLSPALLKRLHTLRKIRATGYTTIAPTGIGKTMAQIDADAQIEEDDLALCVQENLGHGPGHSEIHADNSVGETHNQDPAESDPLLGMERDLDAQIVDADTSGAFSDDLDDQNDAGGHGGFMAADVEYQEDHSIGRDTATLDRSGGIANSSILGHLTGSASSALTGNVLGCDDSDMDMAIEE